MEKIEFEDSLLGLSKRRVELIKLFAEVDPMRI